MGHVDGLYAKPAVQAGDVQEVGSTPIRPTRGEYRQGKPPKMCRIRGRL